MAGIEPDLVTDALSSLDKKYVGESSEEYALRMAHYKRAYAVFEDQLHQMSAYMFACTQQSKDTAEHERRQKEQVQTRSDTQAAEQMLGTFSLAA